MHCRSSELFCTKTFFVYVPGALGTVGTGSGILCTGLCEGRPLYRRRLCWMSCSCARGWHCERGGERGLVGWLEQGAEVVSRALTCT